jgi:hypothetical protein
LESCTIDGECEEDDGCAAAAAAAKVRCWRRMGDEEWAK